MPKIIDLTARRKLDVDAKKLTKSKALCLASTNVQGVIEGWANGEIEPEDAIFWLMIQLVANTTPMKSSVILPN